ncbi:MAG: glycosyltransferase [Acidobacteria bacterium]|nr:glycosyltransferase [Acidobacteriota bacterium]
MTAMVKTSILVLTKNEARNIRPCLEAVFSQQGVEGFEVLVIDSSSSDATLEIARRFPVRIEQIPAASFHHARTRNYAASLARGEHLVYLAADAFPAAPDWLHALLCNFEDPAVAAVYGRHIPKPGSTVERRDALEAVYGQERLVKDPRQHPGLGYRYYHFSTVNAALRRAVWQKTPFPEDVKVFEDLAIAKCILHSGGTIVYEPRAAVYHSHNHTTAGLLKRYFDAGVTWKQLDLWNAQVRRSMLQDMGRLLRNKFRAGSRVQGGQRRGRVEQDLAKAMGMFLGLHEQYLPLALKRRLSAFHLFE